MIFLFTSLFCVGMFSVPVIHGDMRLPPGAQEAAAMGGWDGCAEMECHPIVQPVCGSDGKTYPNPCMLDIAHCKDDSVTIVHQGECGGSDTDDCGVRACPMNYDPVCGSDGKTYSNECQMNSAKCRNSGLVVSSHGLCEVDVHLVIAEVQPAAPPCNLICTSDYNPVCGSDGKTYGNKCSLESNACIERSGVTMVTVGECGAPQPALYEAEYKDCQRKCTKMYKPVCASDGKTYSNQCLMENEKCRTRNADLTVARPGEC